MTASDNAEIARRANDAFASGDLEGMASLLSDDIVWHEIGRTEPRRGKEALRQMAATTDYQITGSVHDVLATDEHVVTLFDAHATRGGRTLDYRVAEIYHVRDGLITERWAFSDDTAAISAFFG